MMETVSAIDKIGQFCVQHSVMISAICLFVFVIIFNISEWKYREGLRSDAMAKEVDKYDPEDPVGM